MPAKCIRESAYQSNHHTKVLFDRLSINISSDEPTILQLTIAYRTSITSNIYGYLKVDLFIMTPFPPLLKLFVILLSLDHFDIPSLIWGMRFLITGHMGGYKELYRIRLCFFRSRLHFDVADWIKQCLYCMLAYSWRQRVHWSLLGLSVILLIFFICWLMDVWSVYR